MGFSGVGVFAEESEEVGVRNPIESGKALQVQKDKVVRFFFHSYFTLVSALSHCKLFLFRRSHGHKGLIIYTSCPLDDN